MQTLCPSIGLFKLFRTKPSLTTLKSLTSTRWCPITKPRWLFPCARWYQCWLFIVLSKLTFSRWSTHSRLVIARGTKLFTFHLSIGRGKRNSKSNMSSWSQHWMSKNERFEFLLLIDPDLKSFSKHMFFLYGTGITSCKFCYFTSTVFMMMSPPNTSLLIPLSLIPLMGLLNSSLPWWNSTSMFLTIFLFPSLR